MIRDAVRERREADAAQAWSLARAAGDKQDWTAARFWFERVRRLAPEDPRPALELALCLAATHDPEAAGLLADLAASHDIASAWTALAAAQYRQGRIHEAAAALGHLLSRTEIAEAPEFNTFAGQVARAAGHAGWCGIGPGQTLRVVSSAPASAMLDGRPVPLPRRAAPPGAKRLDIMANGSALLGSPLDLARINKVEGLVEAAKGGLAGWAVRPAAPESPPALYLTDAAGRRRKLRLGGRREPVAEAPFWPRHDFAVGRAALARLTPPFNVSGADGTPLYGAPIDPARLDPVPVPAEFTGPPPVTCPPPAALAIVIPVYRDAALTEATLASLFQTVPDGTPIIVIDDASPEPALSRLVARHARQGRIRLIRHRINRGFPAAANAGMRAARKHFGPCDILLLNADTLVPPGAVGRLHRALYARPDIGSVTPFSNEATILSYPLPRGGNPPPDMAGTAMLDRLAAQANRGRLVEIPTAIGFCMAIRHDCLKATGLFREDVFAQGYGEENDWCLRARHRGWRHFAATACFVTHRGGASFGAAGGALAARNIALLNRMHPGYDALIAAHVGADPLRRARRRLDEARFAVDRRTAAVALVSHDHGGGIERVVDARMAALRQKGLRPILLQPDFSGSDTFEDGIGRARLTDGASQAYPNLWFSLPREFPALLRLLRRQAVQGVEFHHGLGHHPIIRSLGKALDVPTEHVVHDYASLCKRVNLIGAGRRYCGEPPAPRCVACVDNEGSALTDPIDPAALRARSAAEFGAARVTVPSADAARRLARHFPGISTMITPWEDDQADLRLTPPAPAPRRIAVIGGIGPAKGYDVLMECARDAAARRLGLHFVLIGVSEHDGPLIETGRVDITGPYREGEAAALIRKARAQLAFLPSIWPETWCFALTEAWRGGLYTIGFDIGAQADRIRATKRGAILPLGLPPARINEILLAWRPNLGNFNLQMQSPRTLQPVPVSP